MPKQWVPESEAARAVWLAGFAYSPQQDIIYSRMDAWQRSFGYAYSYDCAAPATISAIIDCEPFFFRYGGKRWMIELWKGQYGLETGAEIGIYNAGEDGSKWDFLGDRPHDPDNGRFFECANDSERLRMSFSLERNGQVLFARGPEVHWWLTGFKWGVLSKPEELVMSLSIDMPKAAMRQAFVAALEAAGYRGARVEGRSVSFRFDAPKTHQPRQDPAYAQLVGLAEANNTRVVTKYRELGLPSNDPNEIQDELADAFLDCFGSRKRERFTDWLQETLEPDGHQIADLMAALAKVATPGLLRRTWMKVLAWLQS